MSPKFVNKISPDLSGRKKVAQGASRGSAGSSLTPCPSPADAGEGCPAHAGRGEGSFSQGSRPGLRPFAPSGLAGMVGRPAGLFNELLRRDTNGASPQPDEHVRT